MGLDIDLDMDSDMGLDVDLDLEINIGVERHLSRDRNGEESSCIRSISLENFQAGKIPPTCLSQSSNCQCTTAAPHRTAPHRTANVF